MLVFLNYSFTLKSGETIIIENVSLILVITTV